MAKRLSYPIAPSVIVNDTYWMIGKLELNCYDQTAWIHLYGYLNEAARHQQVDDSRRPIDIKRVFVHPSQYDEYFGPRAPQERRRDVIAAAYTLLEDFDEPLGLRGLLSGAEDV